MSVKQSLFPNMFTTGTAPVFGNTQPLARKGGPLTSQQAAAALTASGARVSAKSKILAFLRKGNPVGLTSHEIASLGGFDHPTVHKRLPDLRYDKLVANGPVRQCTITKRDALTWKAV